MSDSAFLRRQAETCLRLSRKTTDANVAAELVRMAEDFLMWANDMEKKGPCGSGGDGER
jgi:hypothetical protein